MYVLYDEYGKIIAMNENKKYLEDTADYYGYERNISEINCCEETLSFAYNFFKLSTSGK